MNNTNELRRFGIIYKNFIYKWIKIGRFNGEWVKKKEDGITDSDELAAMYRDIFRGAVLDDFYKMTLAFGGPVERNDGYAEYIDRLDVENKQIGVLDRKIFFIESHIKRNEYLKLRIDSGLASIIEKQEIEDNSKIIEKEAPIHAKLLEKRNNLRKLRPVYTLCMIPRGLVKTTVFQVHRSAWYYLRDAVNKRQAPIIFILHADAKRAEENLGLIKGVLDIDYIKYAFNDVLKITRDRVDRLSFKDNSTVMRKEDHFMTGSIGMDFGGEHATYYFVDDAVLDINSDTEEKNEKIIKWFYKLRWLDDHSGDFRIEMVGTHYLDDSLYVELLKYEEGKDIVSWIQGATVLQEDGTLLYNFPEVYNAKHCESLKRTSKLDQYMAQVEMIPQTRKRLVDIVTGIDYIFDWDEEFNLDFLMKNACIVTVKDPSYSLLNKKIGDGRSRDATMTAAIHNGCAYIFDATQLFGGRTKEIYQPLLEQVREYRSDIVIQDAQGTQRNLAFDLQDLLEKDVTHEFMMIPYGKPKVAGDGKAMRVANVLSEQFLMGKIKVLSSLGVVIAELERRVKTLDFLDDLVMLTSIDFRWAEQYGIDNKFCEETKASMNYAPWGGRNGTTGY